MDQLRDAFGEVHIRSVSAKGQDSGGSAAPDGIALHVVDDEPSQGAGASVCSKRKCRTAKPSLSDRRVRRNGSEWVAVPDLPAMSSWLLRRIAVPWERMLAFAPRNLQQAAWAGWDQRRASVHTVEPAGLNCLI